MNHFRKTPAFSKWMIRRWHSWGWVRDEFAEEFERLSDAGAFLPDGPSKTIWETRTKYVLQVPTSLGFDVVYKSFRRIDNYHYYFPRTSPCAAEAENYAPLAKLGFPLPELLAVGDVRCGCVLKNSFMVSTFAEGFRNGMDFAREGIHVDDEQLIGEFCRGHLALLAKLHDKGIVHRGFTPGNLLYRQGPVGMEFCWVDVATCRHSFVISTKEIANDMFHLFRYLKISPDFRRELQAWYLSATVKKRTTGPELFETVEKRIENRMKF